MTLEEQQEELFCNYFLEWMEKYKKGVVRDVTYQKYITAHKRLTEIAPDLKMRQLTRHSYQNILNVYALTHEKATVKDFHHTIRASLLDAFDEHIIDRDVSRKAVIKGRLSVINKSSKYLNKKELEKLLEQLELGSEPNTDWLINFVAKTGLRFEEAMALTPADFDFVNLRVNITRAFDYKITNDFCKTKNESSVRSVLLDWRTAMQMEQLIKDIPKNQRIFIISNGDRVYNSTANDRLQKLCEQAGVPRISMHSLRHTHASILMYEGISLSTISKRLGHASLSTTQRTYLHMIKELENKDESRIMASMMSLGR